MKLILMGAPGTGKGTQANMLKEKLSAPAISTGQILRDAIREGSDLGIRAKQYTDSGQLVPDQVMVDIIRERLSRPDCQNGFILDGFPRTIAQAEALADIGVEIDAVLSLETPDDELERRLTGRSFCPDCGASYHTVHNPPAREGVCSICGKALIVREDDKPETVRRRLVAYHESTEALKGYFERKGLLKIVSSRGEVAQTTARTLEALGLL